MMSYKNIKPIFILFFLCVLCCNTQQQDYQDRCLYYQDSDSLCCSGPNEEFINITIHVQGAADKVYYSWAYSSCDSLIRSCVNSIFPAKGWRIIQYKEPTFEKMTQIPIAQEIKKVTDIFGRVKQLIVRARVEENSIYQTIIDYKPYKCSVLGDGKVQHFTIGNTISQMEIICYQLKKITQE